MFLASLKESRESSGTAEEKIRDIYIRGRGKGNLATSGASLNESSESSGTEGETGEIKLCIRKREIQSTE